MFRNVRQVIVLSCEQFYLRNMSVKLIGKKIIYFVKATKVMIAWDQAPHCEKKEKKIGVGEKKKIGERSEPKGSLARLASFAYNFPICACPVFCHFPHSGSWFQAKVMTLFFP